MTPALIVAFVFALSAPAHGQRAVDPSGHWEGAVQAPDIEVPIEIDLVKNDKGIVAGTFSQPAKKLKGMLLTNVTVEGRSIGWQIKGSAPGQRVFKGTVSVDGRTITGDYTQDGQSIPFRLTRTGGAVVFARVKNPKISKALEGTWTGTINATKAQRQLSLTLSNQRDGTSVGTLLNVDEALEIPVGAITEKGTSVTFDLAAIGASYSATLSADGMELAGTFTHGPTSLPLTLRKAPAQKK